MGLEAQGVSNPNTSQYRIHDHNQNILGLTVEIIWKYRSIADR